MSSEAVETIIEQKLLVRQSCAVLVKPVWWQQVFWLGACRVLKSNFIFGRSDVSHSWAKELTFEAAKMHILTLLAFL